MRARMRKRKRNTTLSILPNGADVKRHVFYKSKGLMAVYVCLFVFVGVTLVRSVLRLEVMNALICLLTLVLFMIPAFVEKNFKLHLSCFFEAAVLIFIFSAEILGEIDRYYEKVPHWDTALHTVNGFLFAAFGFALLDMINRDRHIKFKLAPVYLTLVAFCFSMTIGVLWEFYEFGMDRLFFMDMQKDTYMKTFLYATEGERATAVVKEVVILLEDGRTVTLPSFPDIGLGDTMKDLMVNFIGAAVFCVIGYFYLKRKGRGKIAEQMIPQLFDTEEMYRGGYSFAEKKYKIRDFCTKTDEFFAKKRLLFGENGKNKKK